ncbi:79caad90-3267-4478-94ec-a8119e0211b5 [Sclerotinia trifoliorum]|uniref:79caad90-3267-4478-94ec-a8119e0211b5 n=1 Tax=Sclerotinia trifoliorum TaxID=28548 RepID=A0A8H2W1B9_9HELO|nr:79caad90-3267-4478-94ec-a8119e0211b5 [Sclerotinia trifoliorum]
MHVSSFLIVSINAFGALAYPLTTTTSAAPVSELVVSSSDAQAYNWQSGYVSHFTIHPSCNATERHELSEGLRQAVEMAEHAKNHILVHGNKSEIFQKYFGKGPTSTPMGWFDKIASGNRAGVIFRCDDPDRNCETQDAWAGHWRGENATAETAICPLSYQTRLPLTALCARGFDVATGRPANFWAADLMHRLYHVPLIGEGIVDHHADGYHGIQELAAGTNYTLAGHNSATLTYFATEAYAYDIAVPGEGCAGKASVEEEEDSHSAPTVTVSAVPTVNPTRVIPAESTTPAASPAASTAGTECHTHADGTLHCV